MKHAEDSIWIIARGSTFLGIENSDDGRIMAQTFDSLEDAREAVELEADEFGVPPSVFRILEYRFTGKVLEG